MITIINLLNKIKWDNREKDNQFKIGYYDRIGNKLIFINFEDIIFEKGNKFNFCLKGAEEEIHEIPFHRIKQVIKNDEIMWIRKELEK